MRLLLILTALMLAIAGGIWWKTSRAGEGDPNGALQTDPNLGVTTFGALPESPSTAQPADASASKEKPVPADAVLKNPHERATSGDPKEPQTAANELKVPAAGAAAAPPAAPVNAPAAAGSHVVKSGETLYRIVLNAYGTAPPELLNEVAKANGLKDPSALKVGQKVKLPSIAGWPAPH